MEGLFKKSYTYDERPHLLRFHIFTLCYLPLPSVLPFLFLSAEQVKKFFKLVDQAPLLAMSALCIISNRNLLYFSSFYTDCLGITNL